MAVVAVPGGQQNWVDSLSTPYGLAGELPPELALQQQALNRRQQVANALIRQGMNSPQGQMAGRFYVAPSPLQHLAQLGMIGAGLFGTHQIGEASKDLAGKSNAMLVEALNKYRGATVPSTVEGPRPTASVTPPAPSLGPHAGLMPQPTQQPVTQELPGPGAPMDMPASADARRQAVIDLMANQHPQAQALGKLLSQQDFAQQQHEENMALRRESTAENIALRKAQIEANLVSTQALIDSRERQGHDANELKRQLAAQHDELKRIELQDKRETRQQGKVPPGYRATTEGNLEAIPGGPADLKQQGMLNQDTASLQNSVSGLDRLAATANQLLQHPGLAGITGVRGSVPDIPGTAAADARALLATLKSQIGFGVLQEMRNNSKTGGALGNVSDAEGKRLENNLAALDTTQGMEQFKRQLQDGILGYVETAKDRLRNAYNMKHKTGEPVPMGTKGPAVGTVDGGYRFKGGDPGQASNWEKVR